MGHGEKALIHLNKYFKILQYTLTMIKYLTQISFMKELAILS